MIKNGSMFVVKSVITLKRSLENNGLFDNILDAFPGTIGMYLGVVENIDQSQLGNQHQILVKDTMYYVEDPFEERVKVVKTLKQAKKLGANPDLEPVDSFSSLFQKYNNMPYNSPNLGININGPTWAPTWQVPQHYYTYNQTPQIYTAPGNTIKIGNITHTGNTLIWSSATKIGK